MRDFVNWCNDHNLINIHEDGTVTWREENQSASGPRGGKNVSHKEKMDGGRNGAKDLEDYEGHSAMNGEVWPYKVLPSKSGPVKKQPAKSD